MINYNAQIRFKALFENHGSCCRFNVYILLKQCERLHAYCYEYVSEYHLLIFSLHCLSHEVAVFNRKAVSMLLTCVVRSSLKSISGYSLIAHII